MTTPVERAVSHDEHRLFQDCDFRFASNASASSSGLKAFLDPLKEVLCSLKGSSAPNPTEAEGDVPEAAAKAFQMLLHGYVKDNLKNVRELYADQYFSQRIELSAFRARLRRRWRKGLDALNLLAGLSYEIGAEARATMRDDCPVELVTTSLHARGCQVFNEIIVLLSNGFADGADARWRTLHEITVTSLFIHKHGPDTATRYIDHDHVERANAAEEYQEHHQRLGFAPLDPGDVQKALRRRAAVIAKYDKYFAKPNGWAAAALGSKERIGLVDLEQAVDLEHWRPLYSLASYNVHAPVRRLIANHGQPIWPPGVALTGPSNAGLADPGQNAALSMVQLAGPVLTARDCIDSSILLLLLSEVRDHGIVSLIDAHNALMEKEGVGPEPGHDPN
jgi:hypothetical protein